MILAGASSFGPRLHPPPHDAAEKALHALNRLGFGPRPGDVDRVLAMGVSAWIERAAEAGERSRIRSRPRGSASSRRSRCRPAEIFDTFERPGPPGGAAPRKARCGRAVPRCRCGGLRRPREEIAGDPAGEAPAPRHRGAVRRPRPARRIFRAPGERGPRRLLDEPLQRLRGQGSRPGARDVLRARRRAAPDLGPVRGPPPGDREVPGDALLPRQRAVRRRPGAPAAAGSVRAGALGRGRRGEPAEMQGAWRRRRAG